MADSYSDIVSGGTLDSSEVAARIQELEEDRTFEVCRVRNDEVIETGFSTEEEADEYIDDDDWNPEKVKVREAYDEDAQEELELLRQLYQDGRDEFGANWGQITLISRDDFGEEEAKERAIDLGLITRSQIDQSPFSFIDWDRYADELIEDAPSIEVRVTSGYYPYSRTFYYI